MRSAPVTRYEICALHKPRDLLPSQDTRSLNPRLNAHSVFASFFRRRSRRRLCASATPLRSLSSAARRLSCSLRCRRHRPAAPATASTAAAAAPAGYSLSPKLGTSRLAANHCGFLGRQNVKVGHRDGSGDDGDSRGGSGVKEAAAEWRRRQWSGGGGSGVEEVVAEWRRW